MRIGVKSSPSFPRGGMVRRLLQQKRETGDVEDVRRCTGQPQDDEEVVNAKPTVAENPCENSPVSRAHLFLILFSSAPPPSPVSISSTRSSVRMVFSLVFSHTTTNTCHLPLLTVDLVASQYTPRFEYVIGTWSQSRHHVNV